MSLVVSDIMFFVAVLAMYMVSTPEKGGLEIPLSAVGTCIMMAGLMLTLLSPLCGAYLDRTQRYQVIMATSFVLTIFVWLGLILNTVVAVFAVLIAMYGTLFSFYQPGLNSLSAGIAGSEAVTQRFARNELFKHLGTVLYAVLILVVFGRDGVTIADEMGVDTETETAWGLNQYQTYFCFIMGFLAFASLVVTYFLMYMYLYIGMMYIYYIYILIYFLGREIKNITNCRGVLEIRGWVLPCLLHA